MPKRNYFGHHGGADPTLQYTAGLEAPHASSKNDERYHKLARGSALTLRELMTDAKFMSNDQRIFRKPAFFFGDSVGGTDDVYTEGNYRFLRQIGDRFLFIPNMVRTVSLAYLQSLSIPRTMNWEVVQTQQGVPSGRIVHTTARPQGTKEMLAHFPSLRTATLPVNEVPKQANTFVSRFMAVDGAFPAKDFRATGWMHSATGGWWTRMVTFVLKELAGPLNDTILAPAIRAVQFGIPQSNYHFFSMLEMYNPETNTVFTPVGEMGFALHEMREVSGLTLGDLPYEEYVPTAEALHILRRESPAVYEVYWEVLCHYHICMQETGARNGCVRQVSWAKYLFQDLEEKALPVRRLPPSSEKDIYARISNSDGTYTTNDTEDTFPGDTVFESFHHQASIQISDRALLAGFLMLWLKKMCRSLYPP